MATQLIKRVFTWALADISHFFFIEQNYIEIIYWQYYPAILYWQYYPAIWSVISNTLPVWKKECQFTASSRDELENTPLRQFAPLNHRDCPRASGCKLPQGAYFPIHPSSRQCIITILVHHNFIQPCKKYTKECLNSWQNSLDLIGKNEQHFAFSML